MNDTIFVLLQFLTNKNTQNLRECVELSLSSKNSKMNISNEYISRAEDIADVVSYLLL